MQGLAIKDRYGTQGKFVRSHSFDALRLRRFAQCEIRDHVSLYHIVTNFLQHLLIWFLGTLGYSNPMRRGPRRKTRS